jgi:hypothetical protein
MVMKVLDKISSKMEGLGIIGKLELLKMEGG